MKTNSPREDEWRSFRKKKRKKTKRERQSKSRDRFEDPIRQKFCRYSRVVQVRRSIYTTRCRGLQYRQLKSIGEDTANTTRGGGFLGSSSGHRRFYFPREIYPFRNSSPLPPCISSLIFFFFLDNRIRANLFIHGTHHRMKRSRREQILIQSIWINSFKLHNPNSTNQLN